MTEEKKPFWYTNIISKSNSLSEELGLDVMSTKRLRDFVFTIAKDQYQVGNKCGAGWAFEQARKRAAA